MWGLTPEDDVAKHVHEAAIAVPDKAWVHALTHTLDHLIVCVEGESAQIRKSSIPPSARLEWSRKLQENGALMRGLVCEVGEY